MLNPLGSPSLHSLESSSTSTSSELGQKERTDLFVLTNLQGYFNTSEPSLGIKYQDFGATKTATFLNTQENPPKTYYCILTKVGSSREKPDSEEIPDETQKPTEYGTIQINGEYFLVTEDTVAAENASVCNDLQQHFNNQTTPNTVTHQDLQTSAGHGNFKTATVTENSSTTETTPKTHTLFLKEFDQVEYDNYTIHLRTHAPKLYALLPRIYGTVEIDGKKFLVMENIGKVVVDAKLAGKVEGLNNPIADQAEMLLTRGREKSSLNYQQMKRDAEKSPHFMIANTTLGLKISRTFHCGSSEQHLSDKLKTLDETQLQTLQKDLNNIQQAIENSPVALIGTSIMYTEDDNGDMRAKISDVAHIIVCPTAKHAQPDTSYSQQRNTTPIYFVENQRLKQQQESNTNSINAMQRVITTTKTTKAAQSTPSPSPKKTPSLSRSTTRSWSIGSPSSLLQKISKTFSGPSSSASNTDQQGTKAEAVSKKEKTVIK